MQAVFHGRVIASSEETVVVEGHHYFPLDSVAPGCLSRSRTRSLCFWKGMAGYYSVQVDGHLEEDAAWTYRHPSPFARRIRDRVAFWGSVTVEDTP